MATFEKGDAFDDVGRIQEALGLQADNRFGTTTVAAVKAWQKTNGEDVTGQVGPDMLLALGLDDLVILENGDEGNLVERAQVALGIETSGEYDGATVKAVKAWQKQNKLKATGNADLETLRQMGMLDGDAPVEAKPVPPPPAAKPAPVPSAPTASTKGPLAKAAASAAITSWAYQLAEIEVDTIAALPVDLVVVDYSADGSNDTAFSAADVTRMKQRAGQGPKTIVSYMSIGEAEDYRYYWQAKWAKAATRPAWLDDLNPDWEGNYKVRFWDPAWKAVIMGKPDAYLDRILAAGFDGVYLDIIDAFEYWRDEKPERPNADQDMIAFVKDIASYARRVRPDFMIIPQNGEALLEDDGYRAVISAVGKEDILFGQDGDGKPNKKDVIGDCLDCLAHASGSRLPILAIEYVKDPKKQAEAAQKLAAKGCVVCFGPRALDEVWATQV